MLKCLAQIALSYHLSDWLQVTLISMISNTVIALANLWLFYFIAASLLPHLSCLYNIPNTATVNLFLQFKQITIIFYCLRKLHLLICGSNTLAAAHFSSLKSFSAFHSTLMDCQNAEKRTNWVCFSGSVAATRVAVSASLCASRAAPLSPRASRDGSNALCGDTGPSVCVCAPGELLPRMGDTYRFFFVMDVVYLGGYIV